MGRIRIMVGLSFIVCLFMSGLSGFGGNGVMAAGGKDYAFMANQLANLLVSARLVLARNQEVINTHGAQLGKPIPDGAPVSYKGFVPAIFGRLVAEDFAARTGIIIKQTTMGKGGGPRNFYNAPDPWEKVILGKFGSRSYPKGVGFGEFMDTEGGSKGTVYRYMLPLYIEEPCLRCHGDPATSPTGDGLDITGHLMDGYKEGELRSAISVTVPIREQGAYTDSRFFLDLEKPQPEAKSMSEPAQKIVP